MSLSFTYVSSQSWNKLTDLHVRAVMSLISVSLVLVTWRQCEDFRLNVTLKELVSVHRLNWNHIYSLFVQSSDGVRRNMTEQWLVEEDTREGAMWRNFCLGEEKPLWSGKPLGRWVNMDKLYKQDSQ